MAKRERKTKEQLVHDLELKKEQTRQRALIKQVVYPFLLEHSKSISDAKNLCHAAQMAIESTYTTLMRNEQTRLSGEKLAAFNMAENIETGDEYKRDRDFLEFFKDEKVSTAVGLISGLHAVIESFEREESTKRPLSSLPAELLD